MKRIICYLLVISCSFVFCTHVYAMDNLHMCDEEMLSINLLTGERTISRTPTGKPLDVVWDNNTNRYIIPSKNNASDEENQNNRSGGSQLTSKSKNYITNYFPRNICGLISGYIDLGGTNTTTTFGSGIVISHNAVLTSAHVIYNIGNDLFYQNIVFERAVTVPNTYGQTYYPISINVSTQYTQYHNDAYDFALLIFADNTFSGFQTPAISYALCEDETAYIIGYPTDDASYQYTYMGDITDSSSSYYYYYMETSNGVSGAPVFEYDTDYVVGIHQGNRPFYDLHSGDKRGVRITQTVFNIIVNWADL